MKVLIAQRVRVTVSGSGIFRVRLLSDLPNGMAERLNEIRATPATRAVEEFFLPPTRGKLWQGEIEPTSGTCALFRYEVYVKALDAGDSEWAWVNLYTAPGGESAEWIKVPIGLPPRSNDWARAPIAIPQPPNDWSKLPLFEGTPVEYNWAGFPVEDGK